jgi:hypothetical protein
MGALDGDAGDALDLSDLRGQPVAVQGVAWQAARADHDPMRLRQRVIAELSSGGAFWKWLSS